MDVSAPYRCVIPSAHGPILAVLAGTDLLLTGRKIASLTCPRVSPARTAVILHELTHTGLAHAHDAGRARLYQLNRGHLAAGPLLALIGMRERLWDAMTEHARTWAHPPVGLVVFGSTARGDGGIDSDVDVLVIRAESVDPDDPAWHQTLTAFSNAITTWTGNAVDIIDRSPAELDDMAAARDPLLVDVRRDGRFVIGSRALIPKRAPAA